MSKLLTLKEIVEKYDMFAEIVQDTAEFPKPCKGIHGDLLWEEEAISSYIASLDAALEEYSYDTLKISVLGRARTGKSYFITRLIENRSSYKELFCKQGTDVTFCTVRNFIANREANDCIKFCVDFKGEKVDDDLRLKIRNLTESEISLNVTDSVKNRIQEFRCVSKKLATTFVKAEPSIEIYMRPNSYTKNFLSEAKRGSLLIIDTPGVSGDVDVATVEKSDMYIVVLKDDNSKEAETLQKIANSLKMYTASSKVTFLYRGAEAVEDAEQYDNAEEEVKNCIKLFESNFADLRKSVINTGLNLLRLEKNCLLFPVMQNEVKYAEKLFLKRMRERLVGAAEHDIDKELRKMVSEIVNQMPVYAPIFVHRLLSGIPNYTIADGEMTKEEFTPRDRVKTGDYCRVHNALHWAYREESDTLYSYFSQYQVGENDQWRETLIKYVYTVLVERISSDFGLGYGNWVSEDKPPRTMRVEESVFAKEVLEALDMGEYVSTAYIGALKSCGIQSGSWPAVSCNARPAAIKKLEIIRDVIGDVSAHDLYDFVLRIHVCGLRKYAEYEILTTLGMSEEEAMMTIKELPF